MLKKRKITIQAHNDHVLVLRLKFLTLVPEVLKDALWHRNETVRVNIRADIDRHELFAVVRTDCAEIGVRRNNQHPRFEFAFAVLNPIAEFVCGHKTVP